jgi:hypothetical protein
MPFARLTSDINVPRLAGSNSVITVPIAAKLNSSAARKTTMPTSKAATVGERDRSVTVTDSTISPSTADRFLPNRSAHAAVSPFPINAPTPDTDKTSPICVSVSWNVCSSQAAR